MFVYLNYQNVLELLGPSNQGGDRTLYDMIKNIDVDEDGIPDVNIADSAGEVYKNISTTHLNLAHYHH